MIQHMWDKHGGFFGSVSMTEEPHPDFRVVQINLQPCMGVSSADSLWHTVLHHIHEMNRAIDDKHKKKKKKPAAERNKKE